MFDFVEIEEYSGKAAHIYSVHLQDDELCLLDQFFEENGSHKAALENISNRLRVMGNETGCRREFFKHEEGAPGDGVAALREGNLRLYCLYFDNTAVFFGSGGYKPPGCRAYQDVAELNEKAEQMKAIAQIINQAIKDKKIRIEENGSLTINDWNDEGD